LIVKLRAAGPSALDELFRLRQQIEAVAQQEKKPDQQQGLIRRIGRLDEIIDQVGMQRYCSRSRLYWYTDLEKAKQAAQTSGKPMLSLRMLGKLNEEFSCANSRFFRTTLYANEEISQFLRDNYILHWKSVRPVPKVTIDFGDGRKLERTLTGNSIHYILTPDGDVVDALPGLYGPKAFLERITRGLSLAQRVASLAPVDRKQALFAYHSQQSAEIESAWQEDLIRVSATTPVPLPGPPPTAPADGAAAPPATAAVVIARPKALVEAPLVRGAIPLAADPMQLEDDRVWESIAALHAPDARLDPASRDLIRSENPTAAQAALIAVTKMRVEDPVVRMVRSLESSIALDMVKNEYRLHREVHRWLSDASAGSNIETLNERVYTELFLTPSSDPWLGLAPADVYTALPNAGVAKN
jgi:DNA-directed RNA polymerase subunit N (RpoN/RPB10)